MLPGPCGGGGKVRHVASAQASARARMGPMSKGSPLLLYAPPERQVPVRFVKGVGAKGEETLSESKFTILSV